jgi:hypothetical protein
VTALIDAVAGLEGVLVVCWLDAVTGVTLARRAGEPLDELTAARDAGLLVPLRTLSPERATPELVVLSSSTRVTLIHSIPRETDTMLWVCFDPQVGQLALLLHQIRSLLIAAPT